MKPQDSYLKQVLSRNFYTQTVCIKSTYTTLYVYIMLYGENVSIPLFVDNFTTVTVKNIIMSPPWNVCLSVRLSLCPSVRLSICLSVCPSRLRVRSISFEPLVGFTNNFAKMSSMMRRCAVPRFDQGRFKVKIRI